ncbi:MAG: kelch repeat-containing protein [Planctomycetota bacterium]
MKKVALALVLPNLAAVALAQGGYNWIQSPINGNYYARIGPLPWNGAATAANTQGVLLATIRNSSENAWLLSNIAGGQEAWINMPCNGMWSSGYPVDFVPQGSDAAECGVRYDSTFWPTGGCNGQWSFCEGHVEGSTFQCGSWCNASSTRYFMTPTGAWFRRHGLTPRYAIVEQVANSPYSWSGIGGANTPSARRAAVMAFDAARSKSVYFGGYSGTDLNDTWEWSPTLGWAPKFTFVNPPVRRNAAMVFDSTHNNSVLFGGIFGAGNGTARGDTWTWNGTNWSQLSPATAPSPRGYHGMAFDQSRGVTVLFGGSSDISTDFNGETWEFDGTTWTQVTTANTPSPRYGHAMFYDSMTQRVVLFGGRTGASTSDQSNETWLYDGNNWTLQNLSVSPPPLQEMAVTYDTGHHRGLIFGGINGTSNQNRAWAYLGFNWYNLYSATLPAARRQASITYHSDRLHLIGGLTTTEVSDPWIGRIAPNVTIYGTGCGAPPLAVQDDPATSPVLGTTFTLQVSNIPSSSLFTLMSIGYSKTTLGSFSLPVPLDGLGMPSCWLNQDTGYRLGEFCAQTGVGTAAFDIPLPMQPTLVGYHLYCQPWIFDPTVNALGVQTGNAADVTISSN